MRRPCKMVNYFSKYFKLYSIPCVKRVGAKIIFLKKNRKILKRVIFSKENSFPLRNLTQHIFTSPVTLAIVFFQQTLHKCQDNVRDLEPPLVVESQLLPCCHLAKISLRSDAVWKTIQLYRTFRKGEENWAAHLLWSLPEWPPSHPLSCPWTSCCKFQLIEMFSAPYPYQKHWTSIGLGVIWKPAHCYSIFSVVWV